MLLLAGLMGMMALGATAFIGMGTDDDDEAAAQEISDQDMTEAEVSEVEPPAPGTSITDFMGTGAATSMPEIALAETATSPEDDGNEEMAESGLPELVLRVAAATSAEPAPDDTAEMVQRILVGTSDNDQIDGSDAVDVANGYDGDDVMSGAEGDDEIWGGLGADTLTGDDGDDTLHGGADDDIMQGGDGDDQMFGHGDDDTLLGGSGDDSLVGGAGDDVLEGGTGADALHGGLGNDVLRGGPGHDMLFGGWGDDTLSGFEDDPETDGWDDTDVSDYLNGGGGDDLITAGAGDIVTGGAGADTVLLGEWLSAGHQAQILDFEPDEDTLMVIFNDLENDAPDVDLAPDPENESIQHIMLNGVAIAAVNNAAGLNSGHITLIGLSLLPAGAML